MKLRFLLLFLSFSVPGYAQWSIVGQHSIGCFESDVFKSFIRDGVNYVAVGNTFLTCDVAGSQHLGLVDGWAVRFDSSAAVAWTVALGGAKEDYLNKVIRCADGNYMLIGYTFSHSDSSLMLGKQNVWVVKITPAGTIFWDRVYGGNATDIAFGGVATPDGGAIIAGSTTSTDGQVTGYIGGVSDAWVLRLDQNGSISWQKNFGSNGGDVAQSVIRVSDGNYVLSGRAGTADHDVPNLAHPNDAWLFKIDGAGTLLWSSTFGGSGVDIADCVFETASGQLLAGGFTESSDGDVTSYYGNTDMWVFKTSATGQLMWQKSFGGTLGDRLTSIAEKMQGGYLFVGNTSSVDHDGTGNHGAIDILAVGTDTNGMVVQRKLFGGTRGDVDARALQLPDSSIVFAGSTYSNDGDVASNNSTGLNVPDGWFVRLGTLPAPAASVAQAGMSGSTSPRIYPTVFTGTVHVEAIEADSKIVVRDLLGRGQGTFYNRSHRQMELDLQLLPAGIYQLSITSAGKTSVARLLKQ